VATQHKVSTKSARWLHLSARLDPTGAGSGRLTHLCGMDTAAAAQRPTRSHASSEHGLDPDYTRWDVSTDLFAVGVTLFELLCNGEHPYDGARPQLGVEVRDPNSFRPDLQPDLAAFLRRACAPYREDRFSTAVDMRDELNVLRASM